MARTNFRLVASPICSFVKAVLFLHDQASGSAPQGQSEALPGLVKDEIK